jgi:hypothetical protein
MCPLPQNLTLPCLLSLLLLTPTLLHGSRPLLLLLCCTAKPAAAAVVLLLICTGMRPSTELWHSPLQQQWPTVQCGTAAFTAEA